MMLNYEEKKRGILLEFLPGCEWSPLPAWPGRASAARCAPECFASPSEAAVMYFLLKNP